VRLTNLRYGFHDQQPSVSSVPYTQRWRAHPLEKSLDVAASKQQRKSGKKQRGRGRSRGADIAGGFGECCVEGIDTISTMSNSPPLLACSPRTVHSPVVAPCCKSSSFRFLHVLFSSSVRFPSPSSSRFPSQLCPVFRCPTHGFPPPTLSGSRFRSRVQAQERKHRKDGH